MMDERNTNEYKTWKAMVKFCKEESLTKKEWEALSWLTLIDPTRLYFGPGNIRWAATETERLENLKFYQSLGWHTKH